MPFEIGRVVRSLAGRDKDTFLVVVAFDNGYPCLCDGGERPIERPKRKNPKHLGLTNAVLGDEQLKSNKSLRRALHDFGVNANSQKGVE